MQFDLSEFREFPPQQNGHAQPMLSINEKGALAMNRAFLQSLGEAREFRAYTHETGYQILLFTEGEPNVRFARAGGTAKNAQLAADLKGLGYRFPSATTSGGTRRAGSGRGLARRWRSLPKTWR